MSAAKLPNRKAPAVPKRSQADPASTDFAVAKPTQVAGLCALTAEPAGALSAVFPSRSTRH